MDNSKNSYPAGCTYAEQLCLSDLLREPLFRSLINSLKLPEGSRGLDIGCGTGSNTLILADAVGRSGHVTGMDLSGELLTHARQQADNTGFSHRISFLKCDMNRPAFSRNAFDWVWSADCAGYAPGDASTLIISVHLLFAADSPSIVGQALKGESKHMLKKIAKTAYYAIEVDKAKNRISLTILGFWKNVAAVPDYVEDIKKAAREVSPGFTILTDVSGMTTPPKEIGALHEKAQGVLTEAGLKKTAEIIPSEKGIEQLVLRKWSENSRMVRKVFHDKASAEAWLDRET